MLNVRLNPLRHLCCCTFAATMCFSAAFGFACASAEAACTRAIIVPVSPLGVELGMDAANKATGASTAALDEINRSSQCEFRYLSVPRIRALAMFMRGDADLLPAAAQTAERDAIAEFIPMLRAQVVAIGLRSKMAAIGPLDAMLNGKYMVNVIRGYDYGPEYRSLVASLKSQNRLEEVDDPLTAARKIERGRADLVLLAASVFSSAALEGGILNEIAAAPIESIPSHQAGFYISRKSLNEADRVQLTQALRSPQLKQVYWHYIEARSPAAIISYLAPAD